MNHSIIKMLCHCAILIFSTLPINLYCQWQWLSSGYTNVGSYTETNTAVAVDENGCVYTTGSYLELNTTDWKIPLKKYAPNGVLLNTVLKNHGTGNDVLEIGNDIAVSLAQNKVMIGGSQYGKPFLGFFNATTCAYITQSVFTGIGEIKKIDLRGNEVWVIGSFEGTFSPGAGTTFIGNSGAHSNIFIAKYNIITGAFVSALHIKSTFLKGYDIKIDPSNNISFTARANQPVQFMNSGGSVAYTYIPTSGMEVFVGRLNASYGILWVKSIAPSFGTSQGDEKFPIVFVNGDTPAFIVGGLNSNQQSSFFQKRVDSNGALICQTATIPNKEIRDIISGCEAIYTTGVTISTSTCNSMFLEKYNFSNCTFVSNQNSNTCASGAALVLDWAQNPVVTGSFGPNTTFTLGGVTLSHPNQKGTFTGIYNDINGCCKNRGLIFDGANDYLKTNILPLSGNPSFTFEAWVHSFGTGTNCTIQFRRLVSWGTPAGHKIEIGECAGTLKVNYYAPALTSITSTGNVRGGWHHIAVTRSGTTLRIYVDGVQVGTGVVPPITISPASVFQIGQSIISNNGTENWKGRLDEIRFWNTAKTQADIQLKKDCALSGNELNLIVYYPLDHGRPNGQNAGVTTAWDYRKVNPIHATLYNSALSASLSNWICSLVVLNGICPP